MELMIILAQQIAPSFGSCQVSCSIKSLEQRIIKFSRNIKIGRFLIKMKVGLMKSRSKNCIDTKNMNVSSRFMHVFCIS